MAEQQQCSSHILSRTPVAIWSRFVTRATRQACDPVDRRSHPDHQQAQTWGLPRPRLEGSEGCRSVPIASIDRSCAAQHSSSVATFIPCLRLFLLQVSYGHNSPAAFTVRNLASIHVYQKPHPAPSPRTLLLPPPLVLLLSCSPLRLHRCRSDSTALAPFSRSRIMFAVIAVKLLFFTRSKN